MPFASHPFSAHLPSRSPPNLRHLLLPLHSLHVRRARQHRCGRIDLPGWHENTHTYVHTCPYVTPVRGRAFVYIHGQIHSFDIQDSRRLQIKTTPDCLMFAFLRSSDETVLCVQIVSTTAVQKEIHAHLSEGSSSTVGSLQTSFMLFEVL